MKKRTPAIIPVLLAALLTTAALMALVRLPYLTGSTPKTVSVREQNGVYGLTGLGDLNGVTAVLPPGPNYYPNTYLLPENAGAAEPESTDRYDAIRAGCLSQRFVLELPDNSGVYALTFRLSGRHALRVYADALAGAAVAAQSNGWVLLTGGSPTGLTELQETLLRERQGKIKDLRVFGGPAAVPDATLEKLRELLGL
ncbi:MAG: cell wall-binding repeat-containing protein [Peptococcaceae bacterium]|nr:cell wall-binding repeat-containing protein [Peptococcaceae bacterium]